MIIAVLRPKLLYYTYNKTDDTDAKAKADSKA